MANKIDKIEEGLVKVLQGMKSGQPARTVFREVKGYDDTTNPMPQAQVTFAGADIVNQETGGLAEVEWRFLVEGFFSWPSDRGYQQYKDFYAELPATVLGNQHLATGVLRWDWRERAEPDFNYEDKYVYAVIEVTVTTEEGG